MSDLGKTTKRLGSLPNPRPSPFFSRESKEEHWQDMLERFG